MKVERLIAIFLLIASGGGSALCYGQPAPTAPAAGDTVAQSTEHEAQSLRELLGESFDAVTGEHFIVFHEGGAQSALGVDRALERVYERFFTTFANLGADRKCSDERLVWVCFDERKAFERYAASVDKLGRSWLDSYYSTRTNRVVLVWPDPQRQPDQDADPAQHRGSATNLIAETQNQPILPRSVISGRFAFSRLTHEVAHQLAFNSGLQKRGVMYPFWISEGLATSFEFDGLTSMDAGAESSARLKCVIDARLAGELAPLRQFLVEPDSPTDATASRRHYAQAWTLFQYAMNERTTDLARYLRSVASLRPGCRGSAVLFAEFTSAFGPLEPFERSWNAFLDGQAERLRPEHRSTLAVDHVSALDLP